MTSVHLVEANSGSNSFLALASLDQAAIDALPDAVYLCAGDGRMVRFNQKAAELWGRTPKSEDPKERFCGSLRLYRTDGALLPHDQCPMAVALQTGECFHNQEVIIEQPSGQRRTVLANIATLKDKNGRVYGGINCSKDITDRKQAEQMQQLLVNELEHRVKNTLANVQAIAQHTLRSTKDPAACLHTFAGRIQSLARVHSLLTETSWKEADLRDLIHDQLLQGVVDESRIAAWGPPVRLEAQMTLRLALVLHELGTNAHKYGALSAPSGWVTIGWTVEGELLRLRWEERGGPAVTSQTRRGFGTTLIEQSLTSEGGGARMSVGAGGVVWEITLPLPRPTATNGSTSRVPKMISSTSAPQRLNGAAKAPGKLSGKRFLVVADEFLVARDIAARLEDAGAEVTWTAFAEEAVNTIEAMPLDAVLLDGTLHRKPVDEIAAALTRRRVPFLFVTGYAQESLPQAFGKVAVLSKPYTQKQLIEAAAGLVERRGDVFGDVDGLRPWAQEAPRGLGAAKTSRTRPSVCGPLVATPNDTPQR
jgi:two-component sensor histidine kinase